MPLIVLEGPEGAGKTTLARALVELLEERGATEIVSIHNGPPTEPFDGEWTPQRSYEARKEMDNAYVDQYDGAGHPPFKWTIIDRAHLSEIVYGHRRRGMEEWNRAYDHWMHVRAWTPYTRQRVYVLLADPHTLACRETDTEFPTADVIDRLTRDRRLFYLAYRRTSWPVGLIDTTRLDMKSMARSIIDDNVPIKCDAWLS